MRYRLPPHRLNTLRRQGDGIRALARKLAALDNLDPLDDLPDLLAALDQELAD